MMSFIEYCSEFWGETEHLLNGEKKPEHIKVEHFSGETKA